MLNMWPDVHMNLPRARSIVVKTRFKWRELEAQTDILPRSALELHIENKVMYTWALRLEAGSVIRSYV